MTRYRLKIRIRAILDKPGGQHVPVTLPAGALLIQSTQPSTTLLGMTGVYWEGRHYSVYPRDLLRAAARVDGV